MNPQHIEVMEFGTQAAHCAGSSAPKGTKTVLLEVARETIGSVKSQKKKKWISDETYAAIREKRQAKGKKTRTNIKN